MTEHNGCDVAAESVFGGDPSGYVLSSAAGYDLPPSVVKKSNVILFKLRHNKEYYIN